MSASSWWSHKIWIWWIRYPPIFTYYSNIIQEIPDVKCVTRSHKNKRRVYQNLMCIDLVEYISIGFKKKYLHCGKRVYMSSGSGNSRQGKLSFVWNMLVLWIRRSGGAGEQHRRIERPIMLPTHSRRAIYQALVSERGFTNLGNNHGKKS